MRVWQYETAGRQSRNLLQVGRHGLLTCATAKPKHMKHFIKLLVSLLYLLYQPLALAQGQDGNLFLRTCSAAIKQAEGERLSAEEGAAAIFCASYVAGYIDAISLFTTALKAQAPICLPERGITNEQGARLLVKHLRENPSDLHKSGRITLFVVLAKAFPCAEK
jgi:Rap1a immunity proteins